MSSNNIMAHTNLNPINKLQLKDEDDYIESVEYHTRILSLLTSEEEAVIHKGWNQMATEHFFEKIFSQMFDENSWLKKSFHGLEHVIDDELINHHEFKKHIAGVLNSLKTIFENITNPNLWTKGMFHISCIHKLYNVRSEHLKAFKNITKAHVMEVAEVQEDLKDAHEEIWDRVLNCIIEILNQFENA